MQVSLRGLVLGGAAALSTLAAPGLARGVQASPVLNDGTKVFTTIVKEGVKQAEQAAETVEQEIARLQETAYVDNRCLTGLTINGRYSCYVVIDGRRTNETVLQGDPYNQLDGIVENYVRARRAKLEQRQNRTQNTPPLYR